MSKALFPVLFLMLLASVANADLVKTMQGGVLYVSGYQGKNPVYIRKYKQAGRCYTDGYFGSARFALLVYKEAGNLHVNGSLPRGAQSILESLGYKPFTCSFFGFVN